MDTHFDSPSEVEPIPNHKDVISLRRRNSLLPISTLSDNILETIFLINAPILEGGDASYLEFVADTRTTLSSSQVCYQWRQFALGYPFLWSRCVHFNYNNPHWNAQLLLRSEPCPISVKIPGGYGYIEDVVTRMMPHSSRIKVLDINLDRRHWNNLLFMLENGMPLLKSFFLRTIDGEGLQTEYLSVEYPRFILPGSLFANTPNLQEFGCQNYPFDFEIPPSVLQGLTKLSVKSLHEIHALSITKWLGVLSQMQSLQDLYINRAVSLGNDFVESAHHKIQLPNLLKLSLRSPIIESSNLLDSLSTPNLLLCDLHINDAQPGRHLSKIVARLEYDFHSRLEYDKQKISLQIQSTHLSFGSLGLDDSVLDSIPNYPGFVLKIHPSYILTRKQVTDNLFSCAAFMASSTENTFLSSTTTLHFTIHNLLKSETIAHQALLSPFFRSLDKVKTLILDVVNHSQFTDLLQHFRQQQTSKLFMPSLSILGFECVDFSDEELFDEFLQFVCQRKEAGLEFQSIQFDKHDITRHQLAQLERLGITAELVVREY
ncbi:hypothetical protein BDZ97DRAFT_854746 [Flammula alnicola]|nr:hypothetical protein BDZ97DRAFT_854746 [Flammula alnicola]